MNVQQQAAFYDLVWARGHLWKPQAWPEWSIIAPHVLDAPRRLEIGAGLRPRLPVRDTLFADVSSVALARLQRHGGVPLLTSADQLPLADRSLDMVAACEVLEHLENDQAAFAEIARVLSMGGLFFFSVPLQAALWTAHDVLAGHFRRYEPRTLIDTLAAHGFRVECFSPGVEQGYAPLKAIGAKVYGRFPLAAMWLEDRLIMPLGARAQKAIRQREPSIPPDTQAPSAFIACRRIESSHSS